MILFPKIAFNWWHWWCNAMMACLFSSLCESVYEVVGRLEAAKIRFTQLEVFTWGGTFSTFGYFSSLFLYFLPPLQPFHFCFTFSYFYLQHYWFLDDPFGDNFWKGFLFGSLNWLWPMRRWYCEQGVLLHTAQTISLQGLPQFFPTLSSFNSR